MQRPWPLVPLLTALLGGAPSLGCDALRGDSASAEDDGDEEKKEKSEKDDEVDEDEVEVGDDGLPRLKDGSIPEPKKGQWKPPEMGSYVLLEPTTPNPQAPTFKNSWLKKRNDNEYLVQSEVKAAMPMVVQAWVRVIDLKALTEHNTKLLELKAKMGSAPPRTFPVSSNPMFDNLMDQFISAVQPAKLEGMPQEDVKTPVGLFRGAYKIKRTTKAMGISATSTIYLHPAVSAGAIKIEADSYTLHLTEVDDDGAEPAF